MEENNPNSNPEENNKNKKTVKINSYWIYGAVIMLLILGQLLLFPAGSNSKISFDQLKAYTEAGDIKKVNVVNESIAEIYLKKESLNKYPNAVKTTFSESQPNFTMEIGSLTNFETKFDKINDSLTQEQRVEVTYERKTNVIGTIKLVADASDLYWPLLLSDEKGKRWRGRSGSSDFQYWKVKSSIV